MLGNPGQAISGRPLPLEELEQERPPTPKALPPLCLRALQRGTGDCGMQCPGIQPDGSCLAQHVRDRGASDWTCEIDRDGYWCLIDP